MEALTLSLSPCTWRSTWDKFCAGCPECEAGNKPQCVHSDCYKPANAGGGPKGPSWSVVCQWPKGGKCHGATPCARAPSTRNGPGLNDGPASL